MAVQLRQARHDVVFVGDWDKDPGDDQILKLAQVEQRVVITRDKDFGTLAVRDKLPSCGIVRLVELPPSREFDLCNQVLSQHEHELARGVLATVEAHRIRIREPE